VQWLKDNNHIEDAEFDAIENEIQLEIEEAIRFSESGKLEPLADLCKDVYSPAQEEEKTLEEPSNSQILTYREALRAAIEEALIEDERVFLMGEDVGRYGGCYAVSKGLLETFGPERIIDTPLCESGFVGVGIGAALGGMRPIVEVMTVNFSLLAMDQIVNTAATFRHMSGGQLNVPVVIRMACGAGKQLAAQHSHSWENLYAHIPGLKVLSPGTHTDARHMLGQALADPDPVILFEHVMLLNEEGEVRDKPEAPMAKALVRREGSDISLITYGGSLKKALAAADQLSAQGVSAEVVDLRCLRPLDKTTILQSVAKTHRAVIIDEGWYAGSLAGEVSAIIMEEGFWSLDAPVKRVCTEEVPIPYAAHLEQAALPQIESIVSMATGLLSR
jgi:pyruvate dehydrogenase E1 component beta subunit/2-oxoisovalerate dehydrogenase E1 component